MQCFFCPNPSAHPATGCEYAPGVLACSYCVRDFWGWVRGRVTVQRRPARDKRGRVSADFATAAGKFNPAIGPVPHVVPMAPVRQPLLDLTDLLADMARRTRELDMSTFDG